MNAKRLVLILLLVAAGVAIVGGVVWFLRQRNIDGGLPGLNPSRPGVSQIESDDPRLQAAPDGPIAPSWQPGSPDPANDALPEVLPPAFTNPANQESS